MRHSHAELFAPRCACEQTPGAPPSGNPAVDAALARLTEATDFVAGTIATIESAQPDALIALGAQCSSAGGEAAWTNAKIEFHRWLYARLMDTIVPRWWTACRQFAAEGADRSPNGVDRFLLTAHAQPTDIFNVFVLIVQSFMKISVLKAVAPTQSEPPFQIAQGAALVLFVVLAILAVRQFRPAAA